MCVCVCIYYEDINFKITLLIHYMYNDFFCTKVKNNLRLLLLPVGMAACLNVPLMDMYAVRCLRGPVGTIRSPSSGSFGDTPPHRRSAAHIP